MGSKDTERIVIGNTFFKGEPVTIVGRGRILGKEYYDIRFKDGKIRTVPADACDPFANQKQKK